MSGRAGAICALVTLLLVGAAPVAAALPPDDAVRAILANRIAAKQGVAFAVVLMEGGQARIITAGPQRAGGPAVDANTLFEIGSVTKTFTSLLLADAVTRGEARLDEPVAALLPAGARGLARDGASITLAQLATHRSGLPRLPPNMRLDNRADPYAHYDATLLLAFLSQGDLQRTPESLHEYSNLGAGLLGYALTYRHGGYEARLRERILAPMAMGDTAIALSADQQRRFATGHDAELVTVPPWAFTDVLVGAGGLRSSASDMAKFLQSVADPARSPLAAAFKLAQTPRASGPPGGRVGLAWYVGVPGADAWVWHNGRTAGFASMVVADPVRGIGVAVLGNAYVSVDDLALHLMDPTRPLAIPPPQSVAIRLDPKALDRVVGRYEMAPGVVLFITREGDRVFAQLTGQGRNEIYGASEFEYFLRVVDAQLSFQRDAGGPVTGVVLRQSGRAIPGKRID